MPRVGLPIHHLAILDHNGQIRQVQVRVGNLALVVPVHHGQQRIETTCASVPIPGRVQRRPLTDHRSRFTLAAARHNLKSARLHQRVQLAQAHLDAVVVRVQNLGQPQTVKISARSREPLKCRPPMQRLNSLRGPPQHHTQIPKIRRRGRRNLPQHLLAIHILRPQTIPGRLIVQLTRESTKGGLLMVRQTPNSLNQGPPPSSHY